MTDDEFRDHKLLILDALKRHEDRLDKLEKKLWAAVVGLAAFLAKSVFDLFMGGQ